MFDRVHRLMRALVRAGHYVMTLHAEEEMNADSFTVFDVERCIPDGEIVERQRDANTSEWKYCISGRSAVDDGIEVVAKIGPTGWLVIITVYAT